MNSYIDLSAIQVGQIRIFNYKENNPILFALYRVNRKVLDGITKMMEKTLNCVVVQSYSHCCVLLDMEQSKKCLSDNRLSSQLQMQNEIHHIWLSKTILKIKCNKWARKTYSNISLQYIIRGKATWALVSNIRALELPK